MAYKQFYLIPIETVNGERKFKYMRTQLDQSGFTNYTGMDYGARPQGVLCFNAEQVDHDSLSSNQDVYQFPLDLSQDVAANELQSLRVELNSRGFSSLWVTSPAPYGGVVRNVAKSCLVVQHVQIDNSDLFGADLDQNGNSLSQEKRDQIERVSGIYGVAINHAQNLEVTMKNIMEAVPTVDPRSKRPLAIFGINL